MQKIIFLVGLPGCGKGTVAKFASGYHKFAFGQIIRDESMKKYGKTTSEYMEKTVHWFHTKGRQRLLAKRMWDKVKNKKKIIIDGCRDKLQYQTFVKLAGHKPIIVYVYSPRKFRYSLLMKRGRSDDTSYKYLVEREQRELKQGLVWLLKRVDYRISNRSTKSALAKNTKHILKILA